MLRTKKKLHDYYNRKKRFRSEIEHAHKILIALIAAVGLILLWRGIWDASKPYLDPWQSIAIGLGILIFSGMATKLLLTKFSF